MKPEAEPLIIAEPSLEAAPLPTLLASADSEAETVAQKVTPSFAPAMVAAYPEGQHLKRRATGGKYYRRGSGAAHLGRKQLPAQSVVQAVAPQSRLPRQDRLSRSVWRGKRRSAVDSDSDDEVEDMDVDEVPELAVDAVDYGDVDIDVLIYGIDCLHLEDASDDMFVDPQFVAWEPPTKETQTVFDMPVKTVWISEDVMMACPSVEPTSEDYNALLQVIADFPMADSDEREVIDTCYMEQGEKAVNTRVR